MVFSSLVFLYAFLPLCLLFYLLAGSLKAKNYILLIFSLFFYAWGEPIWVVLMILTGLFIYWTGLKIEKHRQQPVLKKFYLIVAIVIALSSLAIFKYLGFLITNINLLPGVDWPVPSFSLPIGISFYTFQTLTYAIDLYRGKTRVQKSAANFLLYEALFPQLIAGPIVRYADIADEIDNRRVTITGFGQGISRFVIGLAKKVLIANYAGELVSQTLGTSLAHLEGLGAWIGLLGFTLQIYFDFSGYSDMAIGLGYMFGFHFKENFNYPYISTSITDFWRRWHISLSTFFRDYVYIPLGGNRRFQVRNMFIVWALTGLWHGASWNFVLWGLYFFCLLLAEKTFLLKLLKKGPAFVGHLYTVMAVMAGWVFFYFTDLHDIGLMFRKLVSFGDRSFWGPRSQILLQNNSLFLLIAIVAAIPILPFIRQKLQIARRGIRFKPVYTSLIVLAHAMILFFCTAALVGSSYNPFLYFRF